MPRQSEYRSAMSHSHVLAVSQSIAATQIARGDNALASTGPLIETQLTVKVVWYRSSWPRPYSTSTTPTSRSLDKPGPSETPSCGLSKAHHEMSSTVAISDVADFHEHRTEAYKFATPRVFLHAFGMRMRASTTSAKLHPRGNGLRSKASSPSATQLLRHAVPSPCLEVLPLLFVDVAQGLRAQNFVPRRAQTAPHLVRFEPSELCAPDLQTARRFRAPQMDLAHVRWPC